MRLMEGTAGATALAWVCLYCGAETASEAPHAVRYCDCRSAAVEAEILRARLTITRRATVAPPRRRMRRAAA